MGHTYVENQKHADRVGQLISDVESIESKVMESLRRIENSTREQVENIHDIFQQEKFETMAEFSDQAQSLVSDDQWAAYKEKVKHITPQDIVESKIIQSVTAVTIEAGKTGLPAATCARIMGIGALAATIYHFGRGFRLVLENKGKTEDDFDMILTAFRTLHTYHIGGEEMAEVAEVASRTASVVRAAVAVLTDLGVVLDRKVLSYDTTVGTDKQKGLLKNAIRELCARRFQAKILENHIRAIEAYSFQVLDYLASYRNLIRNGTPKEIITDHLDDHIQNIDKGLTKNLRAITDETVWKQVLEFNIQPRPYTRGDPAFGWVIERIYSRPDREDKLGASDTLQLMDAYIAEESRTSGS